MPDLNDFEPIGRNTDVHLLFLPRDLVLSWTVQSVCPVNITPVIAELRQGVRRSAWHGHMAMPSPVPSNPGMRIYCTIDVVFHPGPMRTIATLITLTQTAAPALQSHSRGKRSQR